MAKSKSTDSNNDRYPSNDSIDDIFPTSEENEFKHSEPTDKDKVYLVFKGNRKKELHVAREVYHFYGCEGKEVPRKVVEHPDFENQRKEFLIKEVT